MSEKNRGPKNIKKLSIAITAATALDQFIASSEETILNKKMTASKYPSHFTFTGITKNKRIWRSGCVAAKAKNKDKFKKVTVVDPTRKPPKIQKIIPIK